MSDSSLIRVPTDGNRNKKSRSSSGASSSERVTPYDNITCTVEALNSTCNFADRKR